MTHGDLTGPLLLTARAEFHSWHPNDPGMVVVRVLDSQGRGYMAVVEPDALTQVTEAHRAREA